MVSGLALLVVFVTANVPPPTEPVIQAIDETAFKAFTTGHPKFLALMHSPWDATCKTAVRDFTAAAEGSKKILEARGLEQIVFVTVRAIFPARPFAVLRSFVVGVVMGWS